MSSDGVTDPERIHCALEAVVEYDELRVNDVPGVYRVMSITQLFRSTDRAFTGIDIEHVGGGNEQKNNGTGERDGVGCSAVKATRTVYTGRSPSFTPLVVWDGDGVLNPVTVDRVCAAGKTIIAPMSARAAAVFPECVDGGDDSECGRVRAVDAGDCGAVTRDVIGESRCEFAGVCPESGSVIEKRGDVVLCRVCSVWCWVGEWRVWYDHWQRRRMSHGNHSRPRVQSTLDDFARDREV